MAAYVVLLGPPGSGKGTQAKELAGELDIPHVATGDIFRAMNTQDTPLARKVREILASGDLVPDNITVQLVQDRLAEPDCRDGAILDGFPRTVPQAHALDELLERELGSSVAVVPLLNITEDEAVRRISGRRSCPECKRVYHLAFNPPAQPDRCDEDGVELVQRDDDKPEVVRQRYQVYLSNTAPLVDLYRERKLLVEVDALRPIKVIMEDLLRIVRAHMGE